MEIPSTSLAAIDLIEIYFRKKEIGIEKEILRLRIYRGMNPFSSATF
jgi:hypothetical protein